LNDLVEQHAPNIQKMFLETPDLKALAAYSDGNLYTLPSLIPNRPSSFDTFSINKVWLDKLGLAVPTTLDEYHQVLKAFKEKDPNGNGKPDEIGFDWAPIRNLFNAIGLIGAYGNYTHDFSGDWVTVKDGRFVFLPETEDYKKLVGYLHTLYAEGLINQEVFTQDYSQMQARSKDPDYAIVGSTLGWDIDDRFGPQWMDQYVVMPPLAAEKGIKPLWTSHPMRVKTLNNTVQVTTKNPDLESTIKWLDYFYTEEMSAQGYYGSIGVTMDKVGDKYVLRDPPEGVSAGEFKWQNALVDAGMMYVPKSLEERLVDLPSNLARVEHDKVYEPFFPTASNILPILKFTADESAELSIIRTDINQMVEMKWAEWITKGGVDEQWDAYLDSLNSMGLENMKSLYQAKYDAFGK
jgi:putative aldouronate transport system substrate-binding protein